ncbi:MAG: putative peptidoglycan glycosyltransferase FtsW [Vampirovibrionales bacterium]|nr:putative peptidoglycan glycosyltransferase FtsW [Vampirovibrionales bacterium]
MSGALYNEYPRSYAYSGDASATPEPAVVRVGQDNTLLLITLVLLIFGLMAVFTATANQAQIESGNSFALVIKQLIAMVVGFVGLVLLSKMHFGIWKKMAYPAAIIAIVLLGLTSLVGVTANGSERWIPLPFGFQLQPSDIAKIAAIFLIAHCTSLSKWWGKFWFPQVFLNIALVGVMFVLIYQQPNLSVSMILAITSLAMVFVSGFPVILLLAVVPPAFWVVYQKILTTPYQKKRIDGWLDPWGDALNTGYNLIQSYYAIGSGGLLGVGLGHSIQKLDYLPFQHTDFIYSVICEELGFLGALIPIGLYVLLAWRGFAISLNCPNAFGRMLAFGLTLSILLQAGINICVTTGLMPVTGVTLPLISYGGTSVVTTLAMIGILLNISRYRANPNASY